MIRLFLEQCRKLYFNNDYDNTVSKVDWGSGIYYVSKNNTYKHSATTIILGKCYVTFLKYLSLWSLVWIVKKKHEHHV